MNRIFEFLLGAVYNQMPLDGEHLADLRKSALADETIRTQKIRTIPPGMIDQLAGFHVTNARSAYLIPFPDPQGGWFDHVKMKVFSFDIDLTDDVRGDQVEERREKWRYNGGARKYIVRRRSAPRLFFPLATMAAACQGPEPLWIIEGPKKSLSVAQLGLPAVAIESAWSWHLKGSRALLPDFDLIAMTGRPVKVMPDPDAQTNREIARAMHRFAEALERRGARVDIVRLPVETVA